MTKTTTSTAAVLFLYVAMVGSHVQAQEMISCNLALHAPVEYSVRPGQLHPLPTEVQVPPLLDDACGAVEAFACIPARGEAHLGQTATMDGSGVYRLAPQVRMPEIDGAYAVMTVCRATLCDGKMAYGWHTTLGVVGDPDAPDAFDGTQPSHPEEAACLSAAVEGEEVLLPGDDLPG